MAVPVRGISTLPAEIRPHPTLTEAAHTLGHCNPHHDLSHSGKTPPITDHTEQLLPKQAGTWRCLRCSVVKCGSHLRPSSSNSLCPGCWLAGQGNTRHPKSRMDTSWSLWHAHCHDRASRDRASRDELPFCYGDPWAWHGELLASVCFTDCSRQKSSRLQPAQS